MGKIVKMKAKTAGIDPSEVDATPHNDDTETEIRRQIAEDPETWEAAGRPPLHKRGRPAGRKKAQVTVSLDIDLIEALKTPEDKGWQTRLNAAARAGLKL